MIVFVHHAGVFWPMFHIRLLPEFAALAMAMSSLCVLTSSLWLKFWKKPKIDVRSCGMFVYSWNVPSCTQLHRDMYSQSMLTRCYRECSPCVFQGLSSLSVPRITLTLFCTRIPMSFLQSLPTKIFYAIYPLPRLSRAASLQHICSFCLTFFLIFWLDRSKPTTPMPRTPCCCLRTLLEAATTWSSPLAANSRRDDPDRHSCV